MSKGLEELFTDHANMRVLLQMLEHELDRYRDGKTPDFELLQSMINDIIVFQNLVHHPKEDLVFARLIQREPIGAEPILDRARALHAVSIDVVPVTLKEIFLESVTTEE